MNSTITAAGQRWSIWWYSSVSLNLLWPILPICGQQAFCWFLRLVSMYAPTAMWELRTLTISVKTLQNPQMIYKISPTISKWIYVGCIALSFLLLALDIRKARLVIASRDISYALTSITAYRYYSIKSYPHYCLFDKIQASKKTTDDFAFFVFFTLKGWKRLLFAEGPRQVVAIITVETILQMAWTNNGKRLM